MLSMLRNKAGIVFLGVCLGIGLLGIGVFHGRWAASTYPISRQVKYGFTLRNTTSRVIPKAEFWTYAPVKNTSTQLYVGLKSSHPYEFVTDAFGNQVLHYTFNNFPPHGTKILTITADLMLSNGPNLAEESDLKAFLRPEKYVESDHPEIVKIAGELKAFTTTKTVENVFGWLKKTVKYDGYSSRPQGALYAFSHKKGDCTELMYLFAAFCRANDIPVRCMGGYVCKGNMMLKPNRYHNWPEYYHKGRWHLADPRNNKFRQHSADYIAMKVIAKSTEGEFPRFERYRCKGRGLTAKMNL